MNSSLSSPTWILVANRAGARLFGSVDGVKEFRRLKEFSNPEGRLKNRDIERDRPGASSAEGAANFPRHGLSNKNHATIVERQQFAHQLCSELQKGRVEGNFSKLILVAEPHLLGEILRDLDGPTSSCVKATVDKDLFAWDDERLKEYLKDRLLFKAA